MLSLDIQNPASDFLTFAATDNVKEASRYALMSTGKFTRQIIQAEARSSGAGNYLNWPPSSPFTGTLSKSRRDSMRSWNPIIGRGKSRGRAGSSMGAGNYRPLRLSQVAAPMQRLIGAVQYIVTADLMTAKAGFVDPRIWNLLMLDQAGFQTTITPKMRRLFFGIGLALRADETEIISPARDWITAVFAAEQENIRQHFEVAFNWGFQVLQAGASRIPSMNFSLV